MANVPERQYADENIGECSSMIDATASLALL